MRKGAFLRRWTILVAAGLWSAAFLAAEAGEGWRILLEGGDFRKAEKAFRSCVEQDPRDASSAFGLAFVLRSVGEPEKALLAAAEGLKSAPDHPLAFLLEDLLSEGAAFNEVTTRLVEDSLPALSSARSMDPMVRINLRWLALNLASRRGEPSQRASALRAAGFLPGAFFTGPLTDRPRTAFTEGPAAEPDWNALGGWTYSSLDSPLVRPPLHAMAQERDSRYYACVPFRVSASGKALLMFNAARSFRVFLDGRPLLVKDFLKRQENPTNVLRVALKEGRHRLTLEVLASGPGDGVYAALLDPEGNPLPVEFLKEPGDLPSPVTGFVPEGEFVDAFTSGFSASDPRRPGFAALWHRWRGDVAGGRILMENAAEDAGGAPIWNLLAAEMYLFEADDLPRKIAESRAERAVDRALAGAPGCPSARFFKALLLGESSEGDEDLDVLRDLMKEAPSDPRWGLALAQKLHARGWDTMARRVLEEVAAGHPQCESVESAWVSFFHDLGDRARQREAIKRLEKLRRADPERESYLEATGDLAGLRALLVEERDRWGDRDLSFALRIAGVDMEIGDYPAARAALEKLAADNPASVGIALDLARCAFLQEDEAGGRQAWSNLKKARPEAFQVDLARMALGEPLPFQDRHLDLETVLAEDRGEAPDQAPSSLILDQLLSRIEPDGSSVERYHGILRINDKEGVDREGEQQIPGQILLSLRTVKPDGRVLEPEQIPEKDTVSLQGLEPGDLVEFEYITLRPPNRVKEGSYITSQVFLFQDIEKPFHRTEWTVEYPPGLAMEFLEKNLPGPGERGLRGPNAYSRWAYRDMPRIPPEPDTPNKLLFVPMVEAAGAITWKDVALFMRESILGTYQVTPEIERRFRQTTGGLESREEVLKALWKSCLQDVDGEDDGSWQDPTQTLLTRQGGRLPLLCAYLTLAGLPFEVLLAEPVPDRVSRESLPRLGQFRVPVVKVGLPSGAKYLTLSGPRRDPSVLPWFLQGAEAFPVTSREPWKVESIPADFGPWERAYERETREIRPDGDFRVTYRAELDPDASEGMRSALAQVPKDQWRRAIQMAVSHRYGSVDLEDYHLENLESPEGPVVWSYTAVIHGSAVKDGNRLTAADPLPAFHLGRALGSLKERQLPLATGGPIFLRQEIAFRLPEGAEASFRPTDKDVRGPFGEYVLRVSRETNEIRVQRRLAVPSQVVWPGRYADLLAFLKAVDDAESGQLSVTLPP
ncbi:MAG: tetratricopeptide repeat protein [Acidobacteriota bacterium]